MELLDRYLFAVKRYLPRERQDDILAELRVNLESQLEDREAELARPLTEAEVGAWLKEVGPPIAVAGKYQPMQYLIGPAIFPTYWYVLRLALTWSLVVCVIANAALLLMGSNVGGGAVARALLRTPGTLLTTAAWVTLVFACLEWVLSRYQGKLPGFEQMMPEWKLESLPRVEEVFKEKAPKSYSRAVAEVIFGALLLVWMLLIPHNPWVLMGPGWLALQSSPFTIAPVWVVFFWWIVGLNVVQLLWRLIDLVRGAWRTTREIQDGVVKVIGLIPLGLMLAVPNRMLVLLKNPALDGAKYGRTLGVVNHALYGAFVIVGVTSIVQLGVDFWRYWRVAQGKA